MRAHLVLPMFRSSRGLLSDNPVSFDQLARTRTDIAGYLNRYILHSSVEVGLKLTAVLDAYGRTGRRLFVGKHTGAAGACIQHC
jgi:hypothetical protein